MTFSDDCSPTAGSQRSGYARFTLVERFGCMIAWLILLLFLIPIKPSVAAPSDDGKTDRPNVLFIAVDDLRPQLNSYGRSQMVTPNMDRLAGSGVQFQRAYCNVPVCGASRAVLMTGLRPTRNRFTSYSTMAEEDAPGVPALNDHFQKHGYRTISLGKVFHHQQDHAEGWDVNWRSDLNGFGYVLEKNIKRLRDSSTRRGYPYERADRPEDDYIDGRIAARAIDHLEQLSDRDDPWFLAAGFKKPHLPFAAPETYWKKYDRSNIHLPPNYEAPKHAPNQALHSFGELRSYRDVPKSGPVPDEMARTLIHGYYACTSFVDAQIGRVLNKLSELGERDSTIVVLWGDHGWQLGEHGMWCKHCVFETSMRVPLIVRAPGFESGRKTGKLVEFVDLFPTLCDLAELPEPGHLDGRSFVPLLKNPDRSWKNAVTGRYHGGETIRTARYRYSFFRNGNGSVVAEMLYDHQVDPAETVNIAVREDTERERDRLRNLLNERIDRKSSSGK